MDKNNCKSDIVSIPLMSFYKLPKDNNYNIMHWKSVDF